AGAAALVIVAGGAVLATGDGSPSPAGPPRPGTPLAGASAASASPPARGPGQAPYAGLPADHVATLPASALPGAGAGQARVVTLVVLSGAPSVSVRVAPLDGDLLAAATAPGYVGRPVAEVNTAGGDGRSAGVIGLSLDPAGPGAGTGPAGDAQLSVTLSADVTWQLDFGGG